MVKRIDSKKWQVPMGFMWMIFAHSLEYFWTILLGLIRPTTLQQCSQEVYVRMNVWRKPKSCTIIVSNVMGALICKCFSSKSLSKTREMWEIFLRIWPYPACSRISCKSYFNASIIPASSDSLAVLTIGVVIKIPLIFYDVRNILKFYIRNSMDE